MCDNSSASSIYTLSLRQEAIKRSFDLAVSVPAFILTLPITLGLVIIATADTGEFGLFSQQRIGRNGKTIRVHKIRTMRTSDSIATTVTAANDARITKMGAFLRRAKLDELPQLWDVIVGSMSLVGPRPDVSGWADRLSGSDRSILTIRPGITGPASIRWRYEESILAECAEPESYNRHVIWPSKVRLNLDYLRSWTLMGDVSLIKRTIFGSDADPLFAERDTRH